MGEGRGKRGERWKQLCGMNTKEEEEEKRYRGGKAALSAPQLPLTFLSSGAKGLVLSFHSPCSCPSCEWEGHQTHCLSSPLGLVQRKAPVTLGSMKARRCWSLLLTFALSIHLCVCVCLGVESPRPTSGLVDGLHLFQDACRPCLWDPAA